MSMQSNRTAIALMVMMVMLLFASGIIGAHAAEDTNPQTTYHEDKADLTAHDTISAPARGTGFVPYQGDAIEDANADDPVKLYSTPGVGFAYKPQATTSTEFKLDLHGASTYDDPDARTDLLHTPGNIEAGANFHF